MLIQILEMVHRQSAVPGGQGRAVQITQLLRVTFDFQSQIGSGDKDPFDLSRGKCDAFTKSIHRIGQFLFGDSGQHFPADEIDVLIRPALVFHRYCVGAQESRDDVHRLVTAESFGDPQHFEFGCRVQPVTRFDLDGGDSVRKQSLETRRRLLIQLVHTRRPGGQDGGVDATATTRYFRVAGAVQPQLELTGTIAGINQVGMAIDQSRCNQATAAILFVLGFGE